MDSWLADNFPELRELQRTFAFRQLQDNQQILSAEVRRLAVSPIYEASTAMNAAFAEYWARTLEQPSLVLPYKATGVHLGENLLASWDAIHPHPVHDRKVIESWGQMLGLAGWYEWVPYALDGEAAS